MSDEKKAARARGALKTILISAEDLADVRAGLNSAAIDNFVRADSLRLKQNPAVANSIRAQAHRYRALADALLEKGA